jgi:type I restriction enzyme M protein
VSGHVSYMSLHELARRAEVSLSAVSNWRARHPDFPTPHLEAEQDVFEVSEVAQWLARRKIPQNRLKPHERPDTTYGDRFLRNSDAAATPGATAPTQDPRQQEPAWSARLSAALDRLRGTHDAASSLEFLLGLVYVKTQRADIWRSLIEASNWSEVRDTLVTVSLPVGTTSIAVPVFRSIAATADPALVEAIYVIDTIDLGEAPGPQSTSAQIAETILGDLERRMGRSGGHFTPPDVARCLVELLNPQPSDRVYDPFCGSGELLAAAAAHVSHQVQALDGWQVYGQTPHEWSWLTSRMNLALHGVEADLAMSGDIPTEDRFPGQKFSLILANPPFNVAVELPRGRVWPFGEPPARNANFAWLQHVVTKLEPGGRAAVVMPGGAAFVNGRVEAAIRRSMVQAGVIECIISLPASLFRFTGILTMVWILRSIDASPARETLFVDARDLGDISRTQRRLGETDISLIVDEYRRWSSHHGTGEFTGTRGFSRAVGHNEIRENNYVLEPGRFIARVVERPGASHVVADLDTRLRELDELRVRAEDGRTALHGQLSAILAGERPGSDGQTLSLGTVCDVLSGPGTVPREARQPGWTPLVLPRNIKDNRIGHDNLDVVPPDTANRLARYRLIGGDIVSARVGTLGRYGRVLNDQTGWLLGPGCLRLRPRDPVDPDYLTYYLGGPAARRWLAQHATGSAIRQVSAAALRDMPLWLPPLGAQKTIVEIVNAIRSAVSIYGTIKAGVEDLQDLLLSMLVSPPEHPTS